MALINCPDCGTEVSDAAAACPKCARPIAAEATSGWQPSNTKNRSGRSRSPATFTITLSSFVLIALAIAAAVWFVPSLEIGQNLVANCQVNGTGQGSCQFTNTGWTPGSQCIGVTLRNNQDGRAVSTGPVCSGRVWPNDTTEKNIMIVLGHACDDRDLGIPDLSKVCTMDVRNANSSNVGAEQPSSEAASPQRTDATGGDPKGSAGDAEGLAAPSASAPAAVADASPPSFDCSKVTDATDLAICSNAGLSRLDQQMTALYFARVQAAGDTTVRDQQRDWIHARNQCGTDVICLRQEYAARIHQLQQ